MATIFDSLNGGRVDAQNKLPQLHAAFGSECAPYGANNFAARS